MEKKNNENTSNSKAKVVSSTSNSYNNIQPRVVLQRLSKDYTFGVASGSDNQPSTSGYLSHNNKSQEVDSSVSNDTSGSTLNTRNDSLVTPSTSKPTTSGIDIKRKEVIEFRVAELREIDHYIPNRRGRCEPDGSKCRYHSNPNFLYDSVTVEENKIETGEVGVAEGGEGKVIESGEGEAAEAEEGDEASEGSGATDDLDKLERPTSPDSTGSEENCLRELSRTEHKIQKAISFLKLLIDTYGRRVANTIEINPPLGPASPSPTPARRPANRNILLRSQRSNIKDCLVRVWLSIRGQRKKKKFHVRLSQLISLLKNKNHPLHKFRNKLNLRTLRFLSDHELKVMARVLSDFVCAKRVTY